MYQYLTYQKIRPRTIFKYLLGHLQTIIPLYFHKNNLVKVTILLKHLMRKKPDLFKVLFSGRRWVFISASAFSLL